MPSCAEGVDERVVVASTGAGGAGGEGGMSGAGGTGGIAATGGAGGAVTTSGAGGSGGEEIVLMPLGPLPYRQFADSPFSTGTPTGYFYLEDFEDKLLDTPGVTQKNGVVSSSYGYPKLVDSVDGDDQNPADNACSGCDAFFNINGPQGLEFTFDETVLMRLPTHVGIVFTDGGVGADAIFTAYDADGNELTTIVAPSIADQTFDTACGEDRFFGIIASKGVKRIWLRTSGGGIEADHLQYGANSAFGG